MQAGVYTYFLKISSKPNDVSINIPLSYMKKLKPKVTTNKQQNQELS